MQQAAIVTAPEAMQRPEFRASQAPIAAINGFTPTMFMTRVRL